MPRYNRQAMTALFQAQQTSARKYRNTPTAEHASKAESNRAAELRLLQAAGEITALLEQVPFELIPPQRDAHGNLLERACTYVADFTYTTRAGERIVEDRKGHRTPQYVIKRKLMLHRYNIRIRET